MTVGGRPLLGGDLMFPSEYVAAEEFKGKDVTLTISKVERSEIQRTDGTKELKPVLHFRETKKKLVLNRTNGRSIAKLHGLTAEKWVGKRVTLYPTECQAFGETVPCIRVRPRHPASQPAVKDDDLARQVAEKAASKPEVVQEADDGFAEEMARSMDEDAAQRQETH